MRPSFHGLLEAKRLVIVSVAGTDCPVQVQKFQKPQSPISNGRSPGAGTIFLLAARGHAEILRVQLYYPAFRLIYKLQSYSKQEAILLYIFLIWALPIFLLVAIAITTVASFALPRIAQDVKLGIATLLAEHDLINTCIGMREGEDAS